MSKHTPGPWLYGPFGAIWPASDVEFRDGKWREKCAEPRIITTPAQGFPEAEANGRLMAAAPDLLDALRECGDYFDNRADADCDQDGYIPNKEMQLLTVVRDALRKAGAL